MQQFFYICRSGTAQIHGKARVLFGNARVAHPEALQTRLLNERRGVAAFRALESRPGRGQIQRLRGGTLSDQLLHPGLDTLRLGRGQGEFSADHNVGSGFQYTVSIGKIHFGVTEPPGIPLPIHDLHPVADLTDFAAVGPGVHIDTAAHAAGNAVGKFQP